MSQKHLNLMVSQRKVIKENYDIFTTFISGNFNDMIENSVLTESQVDMKSVYKKDSRNEKKNYRPVSILSNLSEIYERCLYKQINKHFETFLSKHQFGFRKEYSAQ